DEFKKELSKRWKNNEFELISDYKNLSTYAVFKCNNCGNDHYLFRPSGILRDRKPPYCDECGQNTRPELAGERMISFLERSGFTILKGYVDNNTKVMVSHDVCGRNSSISPKSYENVKNLCEFCRLSKSEKSFIY